MGPAVAQRQHPVLQGLPFVATAEPMPMRRRDQGGEACDQFKRSRRQAGATAGAGFDAFVDEMARR